MLPPAAAAFLTADCVLRVGADGGGASAAVAAAAADVAIDTAAAAVFTVADAAAAAYVIAAVSSALLPGAELPFRDILFSSFYSLICTLAGCLESCFLARRLLSLACTHEDICVSGMVYDGRQETLSPACTS